MTKIYVCCREENRQHYEDKVRKYLVNTYIEKTLESATDVFLVKGEYTPDEERKARESGKNVHKVNEELMLLDCEELFDKYL
ncbi:hypothetical protein [Blautia sp.]|uniref:hypothetical protein n=1 Tax=Blautia sp. TaxID=1955243 RepID=UPI002584A4FD|nr:hypothetical protein [Blautia sp.]